eukprot:4443248-Pyramimonas_sp.AAC.1
MCIRDRLTCSGTQARCNASGKKHITLRSKDSQGNFWTSRACPYPPALCTVLAKAISQRAKALFEGG